MLFIQNLSTESSTRTILRDSCKIAYFFIHNTVKSNKTRTVKIFKPRDE